MNQGRLDIRIEVPMVQAMMFEILYWRSSMSCISAVFVTMRYWRKVKRRLQQKLLYSKICKRTKEDPPFLVSDFGTRRRYSLNGKTCDYKFKTRLHQSIFVEPVMSNLLKNWVLPRLGPWHMSFTGVSGLDVRLRNFQKAGTRNLGTRISG